MIVLIIIMPTWLVIITTIVTIVTATPTKCKSFTNLEFINTSTLCGPEWNCNSHTGHKQASYIDSQSIRVTYPAGSFKSPRAGGFQFTSDPFPNINKDEMTLKYSVYIPSDFDFVKGGKLPGLFGGKAISGGNNQGVGTTGLSLRLMFRRDGDTEVYAYAPITIDSQVAQLQDTYVNPKFGTSLMRGRSRLVRGTVNTLTLYVKLSDPDKENGIIRIVVNGEMHELKNVKLRLTSELKLTGVYFSTFFGGGSSDYSTPREQYLVFSDFRLAAS